MIKRNNLEVPILKESPAVVHIFETLEEMGITPSRAAKDMHIPRTRFTEMKKGTKGVSHDTAFRLQAYLGMDAQVLLRLQAKYDYSRWYHQSYKEIQTVVAPLVSH